MTRLEEFPARIDDLQSQILQFRDETRVEFSAVRQEMRDAESRLREEIQLARHETGQLRRETLEQLQHLGQKIDDGLDQARRETRVLHEDVISRIALLGESFAAPRRPRGSDRRPKKR